MLRQASTIVAASRHSSSRMRFVKTWITQGAPSVSTGSYLGHIWSAATSNGTSSMSFDALPNGMTHAGYYKIQSVVSQARAIALTSKQLSNVV